MNEIPENTAWRCRFWLLAVGGLLIAFSLLVDSKTWGDILGSFFSWVPEDPPKLFIRVFVLVAIPFFAIHGCSYFGGTALVFVAIGSFLRQRFGQRVPRGLLLPFLGDLYVFVQALPFLAVPSGESIRPMGWTVFTFFVAFAVTVAGLVTAVKSFRETGHKSVGIGGILLSLLPVPIMVFSLRLMAEIKGFEISP